MDRTQDYATHRHTPRLWIAGVVFWGAAVVSMVMAWMGWNTLAVAQVSGLLALAVALVIGRVYITALQDRIIKLEMRVRCAKLLSAAQLDQLMRLSMKHIVALRFASDDELPALLGRAVGDGLSPDAIKRAVKTWVPDWDRT